MVMEKILEQLPHRIPRVRPSSEQQEFALYVRLARKKLAMNRSELASRAGIEPHILSLLENHLLFPEEFTEEMCGGLEQALGISCATFKQLNGHIIEGLKHDWGYGYALPNNQKG